ncbi:exonuclease SbcCD subunit D [Siccirubricoccus deserti]
MANFRFLHAADLHLDSPLRGLEARPDVPADRIRGATREALQNLVALAIEEQVDFVVLAGDLYDGEWRDWGTGHFLLGQLARLTRAGIRVVAISGNHDAESILTRQLRFPEGATMLPTRPESHPLPELGVVVHGQGYARREMLENLVPRYPRPVAGAFNIGLLHTSVNGRPGHAGYAPAPWPSCCGMATTTGRSATSMRGRCWPRAIAGWSSPATSRVAMCAKPGPRAPCWSPCATAGWRRWSTAHWTRCAGHEWKWRWTAPPMRRRC